MGRLGRAEVGARVAVLGEQLARADRDTRADAVDPRAGVRVRLRLDMAVLAEQLRELEVVRSAELPGALARPAGRRAERAVLDPLPDRGGCERPAEIQQVGAQVLAGRAGRAFAQVAEQVEADAAVVRAVVGDRVVPAGVAEERQHAQRGVGREQLADARREAERVAERR